MYRLYFQQRMRASRLLLEQKEQLHRQEVENLLAGNEREVEQSRREAEELTRVQIAHNLHDDLGSLLASARWSLEALAEKAELSNNPLAAALKDNIALQKQAHETLRNVAQQMEKAPQPWWVSLSQLCSRLPQVNFSAHGMDESVEGEIGEETRMVVRELLANALRHSNAKHIDIQIARLEDQLSIVVGDDGVGNVALSPKDGMGIRSIHERVNRLNGNIEFDTGRGFTVFIDIPIPLRA